MPGHAKETVSSTSASVAQSELPPQRTVDEAARRLRAAALAGEASSTGVVKDTSESVRVKTVTDVTPAAVALLELVASVALRVILYVVEKNVAFLQVELRDTICTSDVSVRLAAATASRSSLPSSLSFPASWSPVTPSTASSKNANAAGDCWGATLGGAAFEPLVDADALEEALEDTETLLDAVAQPEDEAEP